MRARDFITELFDKPYPVTWDRTTFGDIEAYATVGDYDDHLTILFEKGFGPDGTPSWAVEFSRNESQKQTGEGDSQRIFATVLTAIQTFIKKYEPLKIFFAARKETDLSGQDSQSRIRLYDSLVKRYANAWGYTNTKIDQDKRVIYELTKTAGKSKENFADIKQGVTESLDQPYSIKWGRSMHGDYDALATLDDGTYLSIMFNNESKNNWMVEFYRNNSQQVTGEGDAQRVFATVLTAIAQFIKKKKPVSLFFSAVKEDDPKGSREKLYDRLVQKYAGSLGYAIHQQQTPMGSMTYKFTRKEQGVAEGRLNELAPGGGRQTEIVRTEVSLKVPHCDKL